MTGKRPRRTVSTSGSSGKVHLAERVATIALRRGLGYWRLHADRRTAPGDGERTSFGFREVRTADKQRLVDDVFDAVAGRYDLMNDLMSGGVHRLWKDAFVTWLSPPRRSSVPFRVLDMAGGTGDIAFRIAGRSQSALVTVSDINKEMLAVGQKRAEGRPYADRLNFVEANAEELTPFADGSL